MDHPTPALKTAVLQRITQDPASKVWTPVDFLDLANRDAVDKTLQRMVASKVLRRVDRGLYDQPGTNSLTGQSTPPDYTSVIDAVGRRDQVRVLIDGMTAANELGMSNAVSGQVIVHTDGRLRPIVLDNLTLQFKLTAPSKLYWAGRPAMKVIQAMYWLRGEWQHADQAGQQRMHTKLLRILRDPKQGDAIRDDLQLGLHTVPAWMQQWLRELLDRSQHPLTGTST